RCRRPRRPRHGRGGRDDHRAAGRRVRSVGVPRPLSGRAARAGREQGQGQADQAQERRGAAQGGRPDGGAEAQPRSEQVEAGSQEQGGRPAPGPSAAAGRGRQGQRRARGETGGQAGGPDAEKGVVSLDTYRHKRDFTQTAEPSGDSAVAPSDRLRFVIQKHDARRLHYDLRLELDGVFKSWAVTRGPSLDPHDKRLAVEVEDHPLDYGDFEGTIPDNQYGGGTVQLWDRGFWDSDNPERGFAKGDLKFNLHGDKLHGSWVLVRMKGDRFGGKRTNWLLIKHRDEFAKEGEANDILEEDRS